MLPLHLQRKLELWSVIATLILMIVAFLLFIFVYVTTSRIEGKSEIHASKHEKYKEFGIVTHEDIYVDNMEKGSRYTSHGRLIEKQ